MAAEAPSPKIFAERLKSLFAFDCVRVSRLLETAQYAAIFAALALVFGFVIDYAIHPLYPKPSQSIKNKSCKIFTTTEAAKTVGVMVLQVMLAAALIIRRFRRR